MLTEPQLILYGYDAPNEKDINFANFVSIWEDIKLYFIPYMGDNEKLNDQFGEQGVVLVWNCVINSVTVNGWITEDSHYYIERGTSITEVSEGIFNFIWWMLSKIKKDQDKEKYEEKRNTKVE